MWACPYSPWLDSRLSQHPDHRQFRTDLLVFDLHRISTLPSKRCQPIRELGQTTLLFLGQVVGNVVNVVAVLFLICFLVSGMFPAEPNPTVSSMNFSSLALGSTLVIAMISYIWLRKTYLGAGVGTSVDLVSSDIKKPELSSVEEAGSPI